MSWLYEDLLVSENGLSFFLHGVSSQSVVFKFIAFLMLFPFTFTVLCCTCISHYLDVTQFCSSLKMVCSVSFDDILSCYGRNFACCWNGYSLLLLQHGWLCTPCTLLQHLVWEFSGSMVWIQWWDIEILFPVLLCTQNSWWEVFLKFSVI